MLAWLRCGQLPVVMAMRPWFVWLVRCGRPDLSASMGNSGDECISSQSMGPDPAYGCKA